MIGIIDQARAVIKKCGLRFLESDAMADEVGAGLTTLPGKFYIAHSNILAI